MLKFKMARKKLSTRVNKSFKSDRKKLKTGVKKTKRKIRSGK